MADYEVVNCVDGRKVDLTAMYVTQSAIHAIKKEIDERGLTFEEFIEYFDEVLNKMEQANASIGQRITEE